jgi:peptidylprolyl isomerase
MIKKILAISAPVLLLAVAYIYNGSVTNKNINNVENNINQISTTSQNDVQISPNTPSEDVKASKIMTLPKPSMQIDTNKNYTAILKTSEGDIEIALNAKETPITVNNFVYLAKNNFYNNTIFHRVIKDFMIQGGDPRGDGMGGPGYQFNDEKFSGEYTRGTVAMANAGPNTNGSQFFIMHADVPLPKNYVIFGKVIKGMDVVDKIASAPVKPSFSGEPSQPINPVTVKSVEIIEK